MSFFDFASFDLAISFFLHKWLSICHLLKVNNFSLFRFSDFRTQRQHRDYEKIEVIDLQKMIRTMCLKSCLRITLNRDPNFEVRLLSDHCREGAEMLGKHISYSILTNPRFWCSQLCLKRVDPFESGSGQ